MFTLEKKIERYKNNYWILYLYFSTIIRRFILNYCKNICSNKKMYKRLTISCFDAKVEQKNILRDFLRIKVVL